MYVLDKKIPGFLGINDVPLLNLGQTYSTVATPITVAEVEAMLEKEGFYKLKPIEQTPTVSPVTITYVSPAIPTTTKEISRSDAIKYGVGRAIWKWDLGSSYSGQSRGLGFALWDAVVQFAITEGNKYLQGLVSSISGLSGIGDIYDDLALYASRLQPSSNEADSSVWDWSGWSFVILGLGTALSQYGQYRLQQEQLENIKNQVRLQTGANIPTTLSSTDFEKAVQAIKAISPNTSEADIRKYLQSVLGRLPSETQDKKEWLIPVLLLAGVVVLMRR